jgi:ABC-type Mn2+/Zn2+ transport system permease subunit
MTLGFMQRGLVAAALIGVLCAVIGAFVVVQELAFIGDALAHASFPGVVIAFLLNLNLAFGGAVVGIVTALGIGAITRIVLVVAMLVTPAATASLLVRRFPLVMLVGVIQGVAGSVAGLYLSFYLNIAVLRDF